jgi:dihydrofolate synthase/folylpolyglutamate synthase
VDYRERIRINGALIPEAFVVDFVEKYSVRVQALQPSFFELTCAMAFQYFAEAQVDIAILEVGMGGRLDSTNVVHPELAVITSIGMDHEQFLGDTIEKIAGEKGGIIKADIPVVVSENPAEVLLTFENMAKAKASALHLVHETDPGLKTDLGGVYQGENMRTVARAVSILRALGWKLPDEAVRKGALRVMANTGLRGRWEILSRTPLTIADVGHNEEGVAMAMGMLADMPPGKRHIVWGMVSDKDASKILRLLPRDGQYYWCRPDVPRGRDTESLEREAASIGLAGQAFPSVAAGFAAARFNAKSGDIVFIGGSVFVVAEGIQALR